MNTHRWIIAFIFIAVACLEAQTASKDEQRVNSAAIVTIKPQEYPRPLRNPLKGFTNRGRSEDNEWATLMHSYIKWNEIERDSLDDIPEIKAWCASNWAGVENKNMKVIPRVYLHWDGDQTYWPDDMETYDYTSPQFIRRLRTMIWKLGECWDTDPRVAHIEMGIIGKWGEHHSPSPTKEVQRILGEGFRAAFPHKKVLVRHAWEFAEYQFGIYWDSWAHQDQMSSHGQAIYNLGDRWKTEIIGGETAYNWGNWKIQPGDDPTDTMVDPVHRHFFIYTIRWLHCAQLRWVADYDQKDAAARAGAEEVQKAFGYRYVIDEVTYPSRIEKGGEFAVSFSGRNTGSAPFYYQWPVELSLLDESNAVVWSADFDVDIRTWLPGDKWKKSDSLYTVPAEPFSAHGAFVLDADLPAGQYKLALAVLDPAGRLPSLRFAIKNYFVGGRHPIGYIGVGTDTEAELDSSAFADPYRDRSLRYIYDPALVGVREKESSPPRESRLLHNYPNPFNQETRIQYELRRDAHVEIAIYSLRGRRIRTMVHERRNSGAHTVLWDGRDDAGALLASGVYFVTLMTDDSFETQKMILAK